jgi:hypothetical protein
MNTVVNNNSLQPYGGKSHLQLYKFSNLIVLVSFLSPLILAICIVSLSFFFQNFKGLIFLGFLLGASFLRELLFSNTDKYEKYTDKNDVCSAIQFSNVGNNTFSLFVSAFTLMYMFLPMALNQSYNWTIFAGLLFYIFLDIGVKVFQNCISLNKNIVQILLEFLLGVGLCAVIVSSMYAGGSGKFLFFNETSSDKQVCSQPKRQTFKCGVYKNGELISLNTV